MTSTVKDTLFELGGLVCVCGWVCICFCGLGGFFKHKTKMLRHKQKREIQKCIEVEIISVLRGKS